MFSTPLWLAALATLAIPIALHLWSTRPRRLIQVGSLRHLKQLLPPRARSARLSQPLLLLLRLAILAAIVLALAGPRLAGAPLGLPTSLTLVEPSLLADTLLDSLRRAQATVRLLAPGLPVIRLPASPAAPVGSMSVWEGLALLDRLVAPQGTIDLFARPRAASLGERRPTIRAKLRWHRPVAPPVGQWLAALSSVPGDSVQALIGEGDAGGVDYRRVRVADRRQLPFHVAEVPPPPAPHRLLVVDPGQDSVHAGRIALAVRAVAEELGQLVLLVSDSALSEARTTLPARIAATDELADTLLSHWPWPSLAGDAADPRTASLTQAFPRIATNPPDDSPPPRTGELLLLAMLLLLVERWLSTRTLRATR
jgi:hypothetical protein